jgi:predicted dienelactone hydrolase
MVINMAFHTDVTEVDKKFDNFSVRDARVRDGVFPLLLFSHGNGGMRSQSPFWCEHLASHGYIVVAPDHTGNCAATAIDGNLVVFDESKRKQAAEDRPKDISFLIDVMDRLNKGGDSRFLGRIDLDRIGMAGHSFGGYTSTWVADADPRVKAIAPIAGVGESRTNTAIPVMFVVATEDCTIKAQGNDRIRRFYEESTGPRYLVEFKNGGHYSFTSMFYFNPTFGDGVGEGKRITNGEPITYTPKENVYRLTNGYTTAFFGKFLKGLNDYDAYLMANHDPDELIVRSSGPATPAAAPAASGS